MPPIGSTNYDIPPAELMPPVHTPLLTGGLTALQRVVLLACAGAAAMIVLYMLIFFVQSKRSWIGSSVALVKGTTLFKAADAARRAVRTS